MVNNKLSQRISWIDTTKGIGILLVLMGHSYYNDLDPLIAAFHMPLFYIISGFVWNVDKYTKIAPPYLIRSKSRSYLKPYIKVALWSLLVFGVLFPLAQHTIFTPEWNTQFVKYLFGIFISSRGTTEYLPYCSPIWFLTCIFIAEIFLYLIFKYVKHKYHIIPIALLLALSYVTTTTGTKLWWNIDNAFIATVFMYIGCMINKYKKYKIMWVALAVIGLSTTFVFGLPSCDYDGNKIYPLWQCLFFATGMSLFVIAVSKRIDNPFLQFCGQNTLFLFGYNYATNAVIKILENYITFKYPILHFLLTASLMVMTAWLLNNRIINKLKKYII